MVSRKGNGLAVVPSDCHANGRSVKIEAAPESQEIVTKHFDGLPDEQKQAIVWKNAALGEISIPSSRIVAITQPGKAAPSDRGGA